MSQTKTTPDLPPFVVKGEWKDPKPRLWHLAPRLHPYGLDAYAIPFRGKTIIFPSREAAKRWEPEHV